MANDSANVELPHLNRLAGLFGLHFNNDIQNHVVNDQFATGELLVAPKDRIFKKARKMYMKDVASISLKGKAKAAFTKNGVVLMATVKYGKGTVFAVGDLGSIMNIVMADCLKIMKTIKGLLILHVG